MDKIGQREFDLRKARFMLGKWNRRTSTNAAWQCPVTGDRCRCALLKSELSHRGWLKWEVNSTKLCISLNIHEYQSCSKTKTTTGGYEWPWFWDMSREWCQTVWRDLRLFKPHWLGDRGNFPRQVQMGHWLWLFGSPGLCYPCALWSSRFQVPIFASQGLEKSWTLQAFLSVVVWARQVKCCQDS